MKKPLKFLKLLFFVLSGLFLGLYLVNLISGDNEDKQSKVTLETAGYCDDIIGFNGTIPMTITIEDGVVSKINILDNHETPRYLDKVIGAGLLESFYGKTVAEVTKLDVDCVSGATYSSNAIIKSVKRRVAAYYDEIRESPFTWQLIGLICSALILIVLFIVPAKKCN
ncbi:MAG: FMN-binding protein [Candidatus Limimorpha sp.]